MKDWLKRNTEKLIVPDSIVERSRCCFCWQGVPTPKITDHRAKDCTLLNKFNSRRATQKLQPIRIDSNNIDADPLKEPVSIEEVAKQLAQMKADYEDKTLKLERRLKAVEKSPELKRKADDTSDSRPAKRQKGSSNDKAPEQETEPPKKGKKKGKKAKKAEMEKEVAPE